VYRFFTRSRRAEARGKARRKPEKTASATHIADADYSSLAVETSLTKSMAQNRYLDETETTELSWVEINDVTWKLTDGTLSREGRVGTARQHELPRSLAWLMRDFMADGTTRGLLELAITATSLAAIIRNAEKQSRRRVVRLIVRPPRLVLKITTAFQCFNACARQRNHPA